LSLEVGCHPARRRSGGTGLQALFDQLAQASFGLFFLVAADEFAHGFAGIAVLPGERMRDSMYDRSASGRAKLMVVCLMAQACRSYQLSSIHTPQAGEP
jgi:hypothetical protein